MNLGDPRLELVDPTPNIHSLFLHFDELFFWTKLESRTVVRWSKRMYSCAGTCSYDCGGGLCDIALSEPLLKLRPRKDLIETLLHEMIHAFLFVTNRDQNRDGHGPNFKEHMFRINKSSGLNITIYHDFHDEVKLYQTHWWRCNGPCQRVGPHFGIVRRTSNRAPGHYDYWFVEHLRKCGGTFNKIKQPEIAVKKTAKPKPKPIADITKYINNNNNLIQNNNTHTKTLIRKDSSNVLITGNVKKKPNSSNTVVVTKKGVVFNPTVSKPVPSTLFTGNGHTISGKPRSNSVTVAETVRNVWINKQLSNNNSHVGNSSPSKHKSPVIIQSPPAKIKKIDDYFKSTATAVLKDLYGDDFELTQANNSRKLIAVKVELVNCPICNARITNHEINRHLDECLNKEVIENLNKSDSLNNKNNVGEIKAVSVFNENNNNENVAGKNKNSRDLTKLKNDLSVGDNINNGKEIGIEKKILNKHKSIDDDFLLREKTIISETTMKSDNFITKTRGDTLNVKSEPGTSVSDDFGHVCPCCGKKFDKPIQEHLDECLTFFDNNTTVPQEGASTSYADNTIVIDDEDDKFDESITLNATGTKTPCPCCMEMVELADMNEHLDICLQS